MPLPYGICKSTFFSPGKTFLFISPPCIPICSLETFQWHKCFRPTVSLRMSRGRRKLSCKILHAPKRKGRLLQRMGLHQEICVKAACREWYWHCPRGPTWKKAAFLGNKKSYFRERERQDNDFGGKLAYLLLIPDKETEGDLVLHFCWCYVSWHNTVPDEDRWCLTSNAAVIIYLY